MFRSVAFWTPCWSPSVGHQCKYICIYIPHISLGSFMAAVFTSLLLGEIERQLVIS